MTLMQFRHLLMFCTAICALLIFYQLMFTIYKFNATTSDDTNTKFDTIAIWKRTFLAKQKNRQNIQEMMDTSGSNVTLNCNALFDNDERAIQEAKNWTYKQWSDEKLLQLLEVGGGCDSIKRRFAFLDRPMSIEEEKYPIAYGILVYHNADQVIRMLSSFYHPQNLYVFTYDTKSKKTFIKFIRKLAKCFQNVLIAKDNYLINWCDYGVLQATMSVLRTLTAQKSHRWKYFQYLSGTDLPLRTNLEMVQIFKALNGSFNTEIIPYPWRQRAYDKLHSTQMRQIPGNMIIFKSSLSATFSRESADFIVSNRLAQEFFQFLSGTMCSDESYWSTIAGNPDILPMPGSFPAKKMLVDEQRLHEIGIRSNNYIARYQVWNEDIDDSLYCKGYFKDRSCVFGVGDLPNLSKRPELVAHKIYLHYQPALFFCLADRIRQRTRTPIPFNSEYYRQLAGSRYMRTTGNRTNFNFVEHIDHRP